LIAGKSKPSFGGMCVVACSCLALLSTLAHAQDTQRLNWSRLPTWPDPLGVAGPFVGVHQDRVIVAGGANFPLPVWESAKVWRSEIWCLEPEPDGYRWQPAGDLPAELAYGAAISTDEGVVCVGGNNQTEFSSSCFLLRWDSADEQVVRESLPAFPESIAYTQGGMIQRKVFVVGGQSGPELATATSQLWSLDLDDSQAGWQLASPLPGPSRAFHFASVQNNGFDDCLYVFGGRREVDGEVRFLDDCWEYNPQRGSWRQRCSMPVALAAGAATAYGQSHIFVLSGDDGKLFGQADELRDAHPGFPKETWAYHTITDSWSSMGPSPANQVTTSAVMLDGDVILPTGEVRPRVRSRDVWAIRATEQPGAFGWVDYVVVVVYLGSLIWIGFHFARRNQDTNDYFRGSGRIPWWAAGCSIFATMLSSLTFTGVPSKAFAQDWVYSLGNMMIPVVALVAVYVALPFYRRMDVTSAYEYLEHRFHWSLRVLGSLAFSTFHVFRMAIVMSLTALALAVATPVTPVQAVLLMGLLSIVYCSMGGVSAVIWTDTLQTFVLLGGALLAIGSMWQGTGMAINDWFSTANQYDKLNLANWKLSAFDAQIALWVIVLGAIGQNLASYTADQAVVQRYMTTRTSELAARAIWTNALLSIPATLIFFGIGTSLFLFYHAHPDRLDPGITTDQVFPFFISRELPQGVSGLIVAAIFAAAQSTVSTSMNSVATTMVSDCIRPIYKSASEHKLLRIAQVLTVVLGIAGTTVAISFVDPGIRSLFDQFIKVIGLFMGVLAGLFILGFAFPRANAFGAWCGAVVGALAMILIWKFTDINGYLYTALGISSCVLAGWLTSQLVSIRSVEAKAGPA
jgi:SSS family transporter